MNNQKFHQCGTCGYEWKHGQHGGHSCTETLSAIIDSDREYSSRIFAERNAEISRLCEAKDADIKTLINDLGSSLHREHELKEQLTEAQAQIAMQAETLEEIKGDLICNRDSFLEMRTVNMLDNAISATYETIAAWRAKETEELTTAKSKLDVLAEVCTNAGCESLDDLKDMLNAAKETEPLRREVARLHNFLYFLRGEFGAISVSDSANIEGIIYCAERAYERIANVLSDTQATALAYEREVKICALEEFGNKVGFGSTALLKMIAELRAANKGEVK